MRSEKHGVLDGHIRFCDEHGKHGILYSCPAYSQETLDEIAAQSNRYIANLRSTEWCAIQVANGMPPEVVEIFRALAGITEEEA